MWFNGEFIKTIYNKHLCSFTDIDIDIITTAMRNNMRWNSFRKYIYGDMI